MKPISKTFLKGLIAIIPLTLTLYLLVWLAGTAEFVLGNIFKTFFPNSWYVKGLGFLLGLPLVFFFGSFLESRTFLRLFTVFEDIIIQLPIIKSIYTAIRDFVYFFPANRKGNLSKSYWSMFLLVMAYRLALLQFQTLMDLLLLPMIKLRSFCRSVIS